ncbi:MAG: mechanosensitive ion channel family protein [Clostridia bacterium]|nr:mechanosensitive ion channel family protein [Clostridia bacterium]
MDFWDFLDQPVGDFTVKQLLGAALVILIGVLLVKIVMAIFKRVMKTSKMAPSLKSVMTTVFRITLYTLLVLVVADYFGIPVTSLITVLGIVGLAVSLALQDTLANVFSGLILLAAKTFSEGDYVQLNGLEGTVIKVDLMNTHLCTADNKTVRIPNKDVQAAPIVNFSHEPTRRVEIRVTASYDCATEDVKAALLEAASSIDTVHADPAPFAGLSAYQASSIEYVLRAWTDSAAYWDTFFGLNEKVRECFDRHGIAMTYDHLNVHMIPQEKED